LEEQKRIAAILDQADELRRKRQRALDRLNQLGQAIFIEMFGDPAKNPKRLQVSTLVEVVSRVTDGEHQTPRRTDGGYKLLSARNVRDGYIDFENVDYVDEEEFTRIAKRCAPKSGDILISCSGTIGRVAVVSTQEPFVLVRSAALVVPDETKISPHYLAEYLRTPYMFREMNRAANSSGQPNLFQNQIKRLPVIVPPIWEQMKFATLIAEIRNKPMLDQEASLSSMKSLFVSLQQRAFRGELTASSLKEAAA
jgi:type I restriction enzyme, S subunit